MTARYLWSTLVLMFVFGTMVYAGGIRGTVRSASGEPLSFATLFVSETGTGTTTNENGLFELSLEPGTYTVVFRYLGYESVSRTVTVGSGFQDLDIVLQSQALQLRTVEIFANGEDPAYTIMRKAIAKASYHRQQIDSYTAEVYIKGTGRLLKAPFFLRKTMKKEGIDSTTAFTSESVSKVEYLRPNTFKEKVISIYQTGEANNTSPNAFIFASFYEPTIAEAVSPLSPKAFGYYKFEYEGSFIDQGQEINKIRVIPRSRGENVFEGAIYIVDDWWSIYSLSLKTYKFGFGFQIDQTYAPIDGKAWMPVSHKFYIDGKILGFAFEYNYLSTIKDYKITLNPDLKGDFTVIDEKLDRELAEEIRQRNKEKFAENAAVEDKLASGKEVTRKELRRLMTEYEKEEQKQQEEPEIIQNREFSVDSMATKRDSVYWQTIRPIPLTQYEVKGYKVQDSIATVEKAEADGEVILKERKNKGFQPWRILSGDTYKLSKKSTFSHEPFFDKILFNPVEGWNVHTNLVYHYRGKRPFIASVTPRYAFSEETFRGKGLLSYSYRKPLLDRKLTLEGGRYIFQYNETNPIDFFFSSYLNLFNGKNFIRLYEKDYTALNWSHDLLENWTVQGGVEWARRNTLENTTTQTWFGAREEGVYPSNIPVNDEVTLSFPDTERALFFTLGIEARPWQKYRTYNNRKEPIDDTSPTLGLFYRKGLPGLLNSDINYDRLDFRYRHHFRVGVRGAMDVKVEAGLFLNNESVGFADFRHFTGNRIALVSSDPVGSFRLLDYYRHSTQERWAAVHAHYQFRKFLFTHIPEVWLMGIKENLFVNYLATPTSKNYVEFGYSLDNIFRFLRLETAVAFQNGRYYDWGVLIGVASNLEQVFNFE